MCAGPRGDGSPWVADLAADIVYLYTMTGIVE